MHTEHNQDDLEFAIRILNHRDTLDDTRVQVWMQDPVHLALLNELATVKLITGRKNKNEKHPPLSISSRSKKWWAASVAAMLIGGIFLLYPLQHPNQEPLSLNADTITITPGGNRAQLVLSDGTIVPLGKEERMIESHSLVGIKNDSLDGLTYSNVTLKNNTGTVLYNTLQVPVGGYYKLTLPDGTKVWLNAESELRYPICFSGQTRSVHLKGEAYFDVHHNAEQPFVVHARLTSVVVLGTAFNLNAYEDETNVYTTLVRGKVRVLAEASGQEIVLVPGEQGVMNRGGQLSKQQVEVEQYIAWLEGSFVFKSMKLEEIMRQLRRWYDFDLFYQNPEVKSYEFRGSIDRYMKIERVLKMIEETTRVQFNTEGRLITVSKR